MLGDLLNQTMTGKGEAAAVALYRELRQKYLGTEAYDFREPVLLDLGRQSLAASKPDDALAWLQLNIEFYPKSTESYLVLAQVHERKRDQAAAIKDLEKVLAPRSGQRRGEAPACASSRKHPIVWSNSLPQSGSTALKQIESLPDQLYKVWLPVV